MKVKELSINQNEKEFEDNLSYEEYLMNPQLSESEIDDMEKVFCNAKILKPKHQIPINNLHFQPLKGA
jgi:hypothetical protein